MHPQKYSLFISGFFSINLGPSGSIDQRVAGSRQGFLSNILNQEITCPPQQQNRRQEALVVDRGDGKGLPLPASANYLQHYLGR